MRPTDFFVTIVQSELYPPYYVSRDGRIFRLRKRRLIQVKCGKKRYPSFVAFFCGNKKQALVHRAVAHAFCKGFEPGLVVNHKDNNPHNNNFQNLEWVTQKQNIHHRDNQGRTAKKEKHHNSKLTNELVEMIRSSEKSCNKIARETGPSVSTIARAKKGETWKP